MAVNFLLQRKRKHDDSIVKSIVTTKVKLDPEKGFKDPGRNFVCFLGDLKTPKGHFKIN